MRLLICALLLTTIALPQVMHGQEETVSTSFNLPNYDQRKIHYGFLIGLHSSSFRLQYNEAFDDSLAIHSIQPQQSSGFSLGFVVNFKMAQYLDFRVTPTVGFYEFKVDYNYLDRPSEVQSVEATNVEIPLLFKYKSVRRNNLRVYVVGGAKYAFEASGRKNRESEEDALFITDTNLSFELGFGLDMYYPLFKFAPEIRFSRGLSNVINFDPANRYTSTVQRLAINTVTLYIQFE